MEFLEPIKIPVIADLVLSPVVIYGTEFTSLNFETEDQEFGRIVLDKLDAIKVCRGEILPYAFQESMQQIDEVVWVFKVKNSKWLQERYAYEKKYYGDSYEWGNSVEEMLSDYSHYLFAFHDEFVEVLAKGFWFEQAPSSLVGRPLPVNHPLQKLTTTCIDDLHIGQKRYVLKFNPLDIDVLAIQAEFCQQVLAEVWNGDFEDGYAEAAVRLKYVNQEFVCFYQPAFGKAVPFKKGIATREDIVSYLRQRSEENI
ncbi:hypothetical protein ACYSNM_03545 [Myroides sp. LJL116]